MTMLITKFHRLIQSKLLWATFLIVVVFSFVIWGTSMPSQKERHAGTPGLLDGKPVSQAEFQKEYFSTYLTVVMAIGQDINRTPQVDEQLRQAAWQRIVALRAAAQMGITASDDEVFSAIQHHEGFQYEGQFNKMVYKSFAQNFLARFGFTERQFEEHIREEIVLQKTRIILDRSTLTSPLELQRAFRTLTDRFTAEYVILHPALVEASVKTSPDDARAFFDKDPKAFTLPERVKVDYVRIAATPYIPRVTVTEDEVQAYYDEHLREFIDTTAPTNTADASTNLLDTLTRYRPMEDVKQDITNRLLEQKALEEASEAAMNFVVSLTPDRDGNAPTFEAAAEKANLPITSLAPFSRQDNLTDIEAQDAFKHSAFELSQGPESYFSNPIQGSNAVYVLALRERAEPRVPAFEEVEENVTAAARQQALADALTAKAQDIHDEVEKALTENIPFADALAFFKLKAVTTETFSVSTGLADTNAPDAEIISTVLPMNKNEISDPVPLEDGILLVYLTERERSENTSMDSVRLQIIEMIRRQSGRVNFDAWQNHLLKKAHFENLQPARTDDEAYDEDADTEPSDETTDS